MRMFFVGVLGLVSACSLTGWGGDTNTDPRFAVRSSDGEASRVLAASQVGFINANNQVTSYSHSAKWKGTGAGTVKGAVRAYQVTRDQADHGGFDPGYFGTGIEEPVKNSCHEVEETEHGQPDTVVCYPGLLFTHYTTDTNHDNYISGNIGTCGISSGIATGYNMPASALFQDVVTCVNGHDVGADGFSTGTTEGTASGSRAFVDNAKGNGENKEANEHGNSLFTSLPFDTRIQLLNSVNTQTDVSSVTVRGDKYEVVTVALTGLRIGNATYTPTGVTAQIVGMQNAKIDMKSPGAKLMLQWVADQAQAALNAGQKSLTGSVTVNNAVTFTSDQIPTSHVKLAGLSAGTVAQLRQLATAK